MNESVSEMDYVLCLCTYLMYKIYWVHDLAFSITWFFLCMPIFKLCGRCLQTLSRRVGLFTLSQDIHGLLSYVSSFDCFTWFFTPLLAAVILSR